MNYIKIDVNGVLEADKQLLPMTAGDTNSIVILNDYDQEVATPYLVTAYVKRYDGLIIGPVSCLEIAVPEDLADDYTRARELSLDDTMLAVEGFIEVSIIYEKYDGETLVSRKTAVKFAFYCNESIRLFFNDYDAYEEFKESILLKDFSGLSLESSITDAMQFILKTDGTSKVSTFANLVTYLKTQNTIKEVADVDAFFGNGIVTDANDNVVICSTSGGVMQVGIIDGEFIIRSYSESTWSINPSFILSTEKAAANGVATLNALGKIPLDQMPDVVTQPAKVFDDLTALLADLDLETEYEIGTSFYLREMTQFDFWYTGVAEDDTEVAWYGYKISPLEAKTDLTDYVEKETGKELIPTADLQKLQATDPFNEAGTYPDLTAGKAYNIESQTPYALDEAFDLRVTAGEDVEVKDGLAKVKELQAVVTQNGNGIITDITSKPNILVTTNDNLLEFLETYENTSYGVKVEIIENGVVRIYGTATDDIALETHRLSKYFGIANHYDATAILYATVIAGEIPAAADIYFNDIIDSGITDGIVGTNASITLAGATKYINQLEISLDIPDTTEIDVTIRFYTKHASNPDQTFVIPITAEKTLYTSELTEDDWFKDNVINYETKQFTKYWHKYVLDGSEAWELYVFVGGIYSHFLPITEELTELASTTLIAQGGLGVYGDYQIDDMIDGGMMWAQGSLDAINGIIVGTTEDLATFKTTIGTSNLTIWVKFLTPTITQLTTIDNEILYPAYNYGLEFGLLDNKLKVEYSSDFQKQITTNLENIVELKATKAETYETSVTIGTADWVADGVTATYKAIKTVNGVLSSDNPILAFDLDGIADTAWTASRTEFAKIGLASTTDDNEITFYASAIPTEDIAVIVKVVR